MAIDRNDPEVRALIDEAVAEQTAALVAKRDELLGEVRTLKRTRVDNAEVTRLQDEVETLRADLAKRDTDLATAQTELGKLGKQVEKRDQALQRHLIGSGLSEALAKSGIKPEFHDAVRAMLERKASVKANGDEYVALLGDKPIADGVAEFAASDAGKVFVAAPASSGGGAAGGGSGSGGAAVNPFAKATFNLTEQGRLFKENPVLAQTLQSQAGAG